jgi:hypothetical protein
VAEGEAAADTDTRRALGPTVATASPGGGIWRRDWDAIPPTERREATPLAEGAMAGGVAGAKYLWEGIAKETDEKKRRVNIAKEAGGCLAGRVALVFSHRRVGPSRVGGCIVLLHGMVGV